jgi:hypothetical protein
LTTNSLVGSVNPLQSSKISERAELSALGKPR